ncbi:MAG: rhodanese-like domain-containing protein [Syntrophomonadaceae bacterium]|nr:rhodanese-like domain-containing protein [Syntrophomonadaceae bacterium]
MKKCRLLSVIILVCFIISTLGLAGCAQKPDSSKTTPQEEFDISVYPNNDFLIAPQDLKEMLNSDNLVLLDCNKPDIYAKEHIPGAIGIGFHAFSDKNGKPGDPGWGTIQKKADLEKTLESLGINEEKTVVFYSDVFQGPGADGRAVWQLKMAGMDNVKILVGGFSYWKQLGLAVTSEPSEPIPTTGVQLADYDESFAATKDYVFENLGKQALIDVRSEGEFKGSQKAGEPRGGHIKGAVNMLWLSLLNEDGTPKSPDEIKTIMASVNVKPEDEFTVY